LQSFFFKEQLADIHAGYQFRLLARHGAKFGENSSAG
jgi:hypothetical protein